jgi:hypothetical protein
MNEYTLLTQLWSCVIIHCVEIKDLRGYKNQQEW